MKENRGRGKKRERKWKSHNIIIWCILNIFFARLWVQPRVTYQLKRDDSGCVINLEQITDDMYICVLYILHSNNMDAAFAKVWHLHIYDGQWRNCREILILVEKIWKYGRFEVRRLFRLLCRRRSYFISYQLRTILLRKTALRSNAIEICLNR